MKAPYLSASRLKMAQDCPLQYHYHYEQPSADAVALKQKDNHRDRGQASRLGNNVHDALEEWRRPDPETGETPPPKYGRLMRLYDEIHAKRETDFATYEDGKRMLKRWFNRRGKEPVRVLHVERPIGSAQAPHVLSTGVPVFGFIDLIIEHKDGTIEVIDYKTQRLDITQAEADNSVQAGIYLAVAREWWPDRPLKFSFDLQRHGVVTTIWSDERLDSFKSWLKGQHESILAIDSTDTMQVPSTIGKGCKWCAYTDICPTAQNLMQQGAWDLIVPDMEADLNAVLDELATIKASQNMLEKRKKAITDHLKEDVFGRDKPVEDCVLETDGWSVEWREPPRRSYHAAALDAILPNGFLGTIAKVTKADVERLFPMLPDETVDAIKATEQVKTQRMLIVKPKESPDDE